MVQKVQKSVEVPQLQYEDQVVEVPVTKQVHVPLVETVQKSVEVPQVQYEDQVVHVPVQKQVHVPMVQTVQKSIEVPQVQYEDEIVEALQGREALKALVRSMRIFGACWMTGRFRCRSRSMCPWCRRSKGAGRMRKSLLLITGRGLRSLKPIPMS